MMEGKGFGAAAVSVLLSCSCGGALGFIAPGVGGGRASAIAGGITRSAGVPMVPAPQGTARPRALPALFSSKEPKPGLGGKSLVDSLANTPQKELTAEEKIAALRNEIASQAQIADEEEGERLTVEEAAAEAEAAEAAELEGDGFITDPDFVDEGKNILWPGPRRVIQLTVLAVIAQIAFIVYIITLNGFLRNVPMYFDKLVEIARDSGISLPPKAG